jgi:flavin-dependent dehydrogenase
VNVGIVIADAARRRALANVGAATVADGIVRETAEMGALDRLEPIAGVAPIAHRVSRRAGDGWLLIGDAAGFIDPFTGEGLHRALVSARLGAAAVEAALAGRAGALADYDAAMERRFRAKDLVSRVVQLFVTQPTLFDYAARRLARRPAMRMRMGLLMGDLVPASSGFDPLFLATLLAP